MKKLAEIWQGRDGWWYVVDALDVALAGCLSFQFTYGDTYTHESQSPICISASAITKIRAREGEKRDA